MPVIRLRHCAACGQPVNPNAQCVCGQTHGESRRRARHKQHGYATAKWQALRTAALAATPYCTDCATTHDLTVDHRRYPAHSLEDVRVLCRPCNSSRARGGTGR